MKIKRPLINPTMEEVSQGNVDDDSTYSSQEAMPGRDQLSFKIDSKKDTVHQRINYFKMLIQKRQQILEISTLWKTPALPFTITTMIFNVILLLIGGIIEFDRIPLRIPFYYNSIDKHWEQTDKSTIFIVGFLYLLFEMIIIYLTTKIFKNDKRLALTICWVMTLLNMLILISIIQIYSLIA